MFFICRFPNSAEGFSSGFLRSVYREKGAFEMAENKENQNPKLKRPEDITPEIREILSERWGEQSDERYIAMERDYRNLKSDNEDVFDSVAMHLRDMVKWRMLREDAIRENDTKMITALNQSIKQADGMIKAAREQKTIVKRSVDGLVTALEKHGMMKDGVFLLNGVINYIRNDKGRFNMSRDALDAQILAITNTMRMNNGLSELVELPEELQVQDRLGEFMAEPSFKERETMMELGMAVRRQGAKH